MTSPGHRYGGGRRVFVGTVLRSFLDQQAHHVTNVPRSAALLLSARIAMLAIGVDIGIGLRGQMFQLWSGEDPNIDASQSFCFYFIRYTKCGKNYPSKIICCFLSTRWNFRAKFYVFI